MNTSFYNGISGVKTQQFGMDVWANNISNISTTGYRSSTPEFSSLFSATLTGSYFDPTSNDKGLGAQSQTTGLNLTQGILENTDSPFDLAINGEGWFGVQAQSGDIYYTRAGAFSLDANGDLVDVGGNYLMATSGSNITPTTLDEETLAKFGQYYNPQTSIYSTSIPYEISPLYDVPLGEVGTQTKINLPDLLYLPPTPTTKVSYGANLEPTVNIEPVMIALNTLDYPTTVTANTSNTINFSGTISNTPEVLSPQTDDKIFVTLTDINGKELDALALLDENNNWNISGYDVSDLDLSADIQVSAKIQTTQEIANVEHFSTNIISPSGSKDILDMTFTKRVPQGTEGSTWDAQVKILSFYETYNPDTTYDPTLYQVNSETQKVYTIVDAQVGELTFAGSGALLTNTIPILSNGETEMELNLGEPNSFEQMVSSIGFSKGNSVEVNGVEEGFLEGYGLDGYGNIVAEFSNGHSSAIAKVALYHFQNDGGLLSETSTYFTPSSNSGNPIFYADENGASFLGSTILSSKLEGSNVNFATALTELIITQKAFDANAKSITTSDQLIQNAINMKK